jgi:6-deoxyerythronolide B hydroxylase
MQQDAQELEGLVQAAMYTPEGLQSPYSFLDQLVGRADLFESSSGMMFVCGYDLAMTMLRSPRFLKQGRHGSWLFSKLTPEQDAQLRREAPATPGWLSMLDPPDHTRLRRLVSLAFTPKSVDALRDHVASTLTARLDALPPGEPVDLVAEVCVPIPADVIGTLLGIPIADRDWFLQLAAINAKEQDPPSTFEDKLRAVRARRELLEYVESMLDERRREPKDDLTGRLIALEEQGERISAEELASLVLILYTAGFLTTAHMLGNGLVAFMRDPEQAAALRDDPALARNATDEVLRLHAPSATVGYTAADELEPGELPLKPAAPHTVLLGVANRDPRRFESPFSFDVRPKRDWPHLSFGFGLHFCLGAALARLEGDVVFTEMVRRYPDMQLAEDQPRHIQSFRLNGYERILAVLQP